MGVAPRRARAGGKDAIERLWALWVDLDQVDAAAALERLPVAPSIVIASGTPGHLHAYWTLSRPVTVKAAEQANRRLAAELGGDTGAVTNAATILRPCGTHSFKTKPPTPVVLERLDGTLTTLEAVTAGIATDPSPPAPAPRRPSPRGSRPRGRRPAAGARPRPLRQRPDGRDGGALQEGELPLPRGPHPQPSRLRERRRRVVLLRLQTPRTLGLRPSESAVGTRHPGPELRRAPRPPLRPVPPRPDTARPAPRPRAALRRRRHATHAHPTTRRSAFQPC